MSLRTILSLTISLLAVLGCSGASSPVTEAPAPNTTPLAVPVEAPTIPEQQPVGAFVGTSWKAADYCEDGPVLVTFGPEVPDQGLKVTVGLERGEQVMENYCDSKAPGLLDCKSENYFWSFQTQGSGLHMIAAPVQEGEPGCTVDLTKN